jgi:hypothetical protein
VTANQPARTAMIPNDSRPTGFAFARVFRELTSAASLFDMSGNQPITICNSGSFHILVDRYLYLESGGSDVGSNSSFLSLDSDSYRGFRFENPPCL